MLNRRRWLKLFPVAAALCGLFGEARAQQPADAGEPPTEPDDQELTDEQLRGLGVDSDQPSEAIYIVPVRDVVVPGAAQAIDNEQLERFEHDDVHRILGDVSGVYIREEDGYGLRPNIGMRGSGSERSAKITLMEDGILIAPAPYAAPAAYYFPLLTKMNRVEVLKGPASVRYGPNTVGGALNMLTQPIGREQKVGLDAAVGNDLYAKLHSSYAGSSEHVGLLVEGVKLRTDGFKKLDGGGDTGFDKNDVALKLRFNTDVTGSTYNELVLRFGYSDEVSNETYTGLTDDDFEDNPYRRYFGTRLDRLDWDHRQVQLVHKLEIGAAFSVVTQLYRHDFDRSWRKLNGFVGADIRDVLANPTTGNNAVLFAILTGASDSTSSEESLVMGTNRREFVSQGIQTTASFEKELVGFAHRFTTGLRFHYDSALRQHDEQSYLAVGGELVADEATLVDTRDTFGSATTMAAHIQDEANHGRLTLHAGGRLELISIEHTDRADRMNDADDFYSVFIPGGGVFYEVVPELGVLAGIHRGFVPVAPGQNQDVNPESSTNYELGGRFGKSWEALSLQAELIGFFNDYANLKGTCSFSSGCADEQVGDEFNGGRVHTLGVESSASATVTRGRFRFPVRGNYTLNRSRFRSSFRSANPQWGDVQSGDEIPYLPAHQLSLGGGVIGPGFAKHRWEVALSGRYTSAMRDTAGSGAFDFEDGAESQTVLDLAASYQIPTWGKAYLTVSNVFDQAHIVSRRPFGARPGKPRFFILGYKNAL